MRIESMRDILENTAIDHVYYRTYNPLTRCVGREYTPHRAAHVALLVAAGKLTWTPDVVESMYWGFNSRIDLYWNLENAGSLFNTDEGEWDRPARADVVDAGVAPDFVKQIEANVKSSGNVFGLKDDAAAVGKANILYLVDDVTRAHTPEVAEAMQKALDYKGVKYAKLAKGTDGWCLYDLGLWALAEEKAKEYAGFIKESGAKTVVANNPAVVYALKEWYPTMNLKVDAEVLHHTEYLAKLGEVFPGKLSGKVTYHDPAYLGRYLEVYDEPRQLIEKMGGEFVECYFNREKSNPTGPQYDYFNWEWADMIAARRAEELVFSAPTVLTAAPSSKRNLSRVADAAGIKVMDIVEALVG